MTRSESLNKKPELKKNVRRTKRYRRKITKKQIFAEKVIVFVWKFALILSCLITKEFWRLCYGLYLLTDFILVFELEKTDS